MNVEVVTPQIPIAEVFTSIHGEGHWAGTRMTFFRTAGCNVGKISTGPLVMLPTGKTATTCTTYDGRTFPCDTDYNKTESCTPAQLLSRIPPGVSHVCITGGEPLLHAKALFPLVTSLHAQGIMTHLETSGTFLIPGWLKGFSSWVTCSPKANYHSSVVHEDADEIRIMVDKAFTFAPAGIVGCRGQVFLCPISDPGDVTRFDRDSIDRCLELIGTPEFHKARISIQMHKILNVR